MSPFLSRRTHAPTAPVGYAFVDLSTPNEAERAIAELSGKEILERKVSVQLARKPEPAEKTEGANGEGSGEGTGAASPPADADGLVVDVAAVLVVAVRV